MIKLLLLIAWGWCMVETPSAPLVGGSIDGGASQEQPLVIQSTGQDMHDSLQAAVRHHAYIVLDGQKGDFIVSRPIEIHHLTGRLIEGRNDARICTQFVMDPVAVDSLRKMRLDTLDSHGGGFTLSNGKHPGEQHESVVRQFLIDWFQDPQEQYARAGIFGLKDAHQVVIRNLRLQGPGSIDIGGSDLMTISQGSTHIWVDHCDFQDGQDGNLDINSKSDLITVSHCRFHYSDRSFDHSLSNLIGSGDNPEKEGEDNLNITFQECEWGPGCIQRMPMVRFGTVHLYKCLYTCVGNQKCIDARLGSQVLIDSCQFAEGVNRPYSIGEGNLSLELRDIQLPTQQIPTWRRGPEIVLPY